MRWYKKQLDKIMKEKSESTEKDQKTTTKKVLGNSFAERKKWNVKRSYPSPVAASKLARPKTDSH